MVLPKRLFPLLVRYYIFELQGLRFLWLFFRLLLLLLLRYSLEKNSWGEKFYTIGSNSYFFQEGTAIKYETAKYGMLKVVTKGELIGTCSLVGLCDADKNLIK